jgi:hypothetical protein
VGHNTGCFTISNATAQSFFVIDGEDPARTLTIPSNGSANYGGTIVPWCADSFDVRTKAFRFFTGAVGAFFIFQVGSSTIATSPFATAAFPGTSLISFASRIELSIDSAGRPSARSF